MMLDTRSGSRADVGTIDGRSAVGLESMMLPMTSSGTSDVGTAVGAAETISDGAAVTCEITDARMLVRTPGSRFEVGTAVGSKSVPILPMILVRAPSGINEVGT